MKNVFRQKQVPKFLLRSEIEELLAVSEKAGQQLFPMPPFDENQKVQEELIGRYGFVE